MPLTRKLIRTDGTCQDLRPGTPMRELRKLMGAQSVGTVILRHMGHPMHVMLVDDNGYETETKATARGIELVPVRALRPVNVEATRLYHLNCLPGTTHQIVGDVVIVPDEDFA